MTKNFSNIGPRRSRQSGMAIAEVLLLTIPLSILSLVVTSRLTAVASARHESLWRSSVLAQQDARTPTCGVNGEYLAAEAAAMAVNAKSGQMEKIGKSALVQIPAVALIMGKTGDLTRDKTVAVPAYHFAAAAQRLIPAASSPSALTSRANFLCNEPFDHSDRDNMSVWVFALGEWQAYRMYHSDTAQEQPKYDSSPQLPAGGSPDSGSTNGPVGGVTHLVEENLGDPQ